MSRQRVDNWCEKGIQGLVLGILVFGPLATGAVGALELLVIQSLTMAATLLWVFRIWLNPNIRFWQPPVCWVVVAFVCYAILRYRQADLEYVARKELIRILIYSFLFFVILNNLSHQETTQLTSCVLIFLGMAISMYAFYQFSTNSDHVWHFIKPAMYRHRGSGTYICPNHLAGFLEMLLPLGLAYTFTSRLGSLMRVFLGYASLVILAGIAVSVSRGGWLATVMSLVVFFGFLARNRQYRLPSLVVLAVLAAGATAFYVKSYEPQKRIQQIFTLGPPEDPHSRLWLWKPAIQMW